MTRSLLLPGLAFACALGFATITSAEVAPASMGADAGRVSELVEI